MCHTFAQCRRRCIKGCFAGFTGGALHGSSTSALEFAEDTVGRHQTRPFEGWLHGAQGEARRSTRSGRAGVGLARGRGRASCCRCCGVIFLDNAPTKTTARRTLSLHVARWPERYLPIQAVLGVEHSLPQRCDRVSALHQAGALVSARAAWTFDGRIRLFRVPLG